jgi:Skp family chaperone for outer membrane proteins
MAYVNIQMVAAESVEGREAQERVGELNEEKVQELTAMNQELQSLQEKLQQESTVLSATARLEQEKRIERMQVDLQRFTEDAQAEVQALQQELQEEFQRKLMPIIAQVASSMGLHMVFSQLDAGLVWADTGLDITVEIIAEFDRASSIQADAEGAQLSKEQSLEF